MDEFEKELKVGFLDEAAQLLTDTEQCFLDLENNPNDSPTLDKIFRLAHNLKGSSKAVGFEDIGVFTHQFETFLLKLKNGELQIRPDTISLLLRCNDHCRMMVETLKENLDARIDSSVLLQEIEDHSRAPQDDPDTFSAKPEEIKLVESLEDVVAESLAPPASNAIKQDFVELEAVVKESVEESIKESIRPEATPLKEKPKSQNQTDESIRVSLARLEKLINSVGELVIFQTVLREQSLTANTLLLRKTIHQMGKVTKEVQDISMSLRMVPLKQTFQKMQRIVRDTSSALNKKVNFVISGEETELDKTVLENIGDPLVHLVRNACDHGIESPERRLESGKSEFGTVFLSAYHRSGRLVIEVKEDGAGIDPERLMGKAVEKGILKPGQRLPEKDAVNLIFHPGFSTKAQVTEVSGRGVGMDVVKTNIEALQGVVEVDTVLGKGTTFRIILPLTLAIIDGMVITSGESRFVVPLSHVHESLKPETQDLSFTTGMGECLLLRGETLPLYRLSALLNNKSQDKESIAMVIRSGPQPFAIMVDDIVGQQQVVIKEVGKEIQNMKWMSGSAILGDGKPAIILELSELIQKNVNVKSLPQNSQKRGVA